MNSHIAIPNYQYHEEEITLDDFELIRCIGHGAYGQVWMCLKKDTQILYAMKILLKSQLTRNSTYNRAMRERTLLEQLDNPFIIKLRYSFQDDTALYYVMDYYSGGDLYSLIEQQPYNRMKEEESKFYLAEIVVALQAMHECGVVYRDLKLENILLTSDGHIVFSDLGMSRYLQEGERTYSFVGTPQYMSPEIVNRQGHTYTTDFWSLGILAYQLLVGVVPYDGNTMDIVFHRISHQPVILPPYLSNQAKHFISSLLQKNPMDRLGSRGFDEIINHPFFNGIEWEKIRSQSFPLPLLYNEKNESLIQKNYFDHFSYYIDKTDRYEQKQLIKQFLVAWFHSDLQHPCLHRMISSCYGQIPSRANYSQNQNACYYHFLNKEEFIQHCSKESSLYPDICSILQTFSIRLEESTILFEGEKCLCQWRGWGQIHGSQFVCILGSISATITTDNWIKQVDIHTALSPNRLFPSLAQQEDLLPSLLLQQNTKQFLQSFLQTIQNPSTKLFYDYQQSLKQIQSFTSRISIYQSNILLQEDTFEDIIVYLMNSIQHRHILFLPNTSFTSSYSHPVYFLLYGDIEYSLFNRIPMDNVGYLYGSLALENNQLMGEIYLDAIAEETMIQSLFSHIHELNDNTLNNILNTISFTNEVERVCWCSLFQSLQKQDYLSSLQAIKQITKHWYLQEPILSVEAIYKHIQQKIQFISYDNLVSTEFTRLFIAYELQEFFSHLVIQNQ